jgi:GT2 family glycosyltransferase
MGYCPASIVHHYWSGSFGKKPSDFKLFYGNRNTIVNFLLFYEVKTIVKLFPLFLLTQLGHLFFNAPRKRLKAKLKARWWIFGHWNQIKSLRNKVQKDKKLTDSELLSLLSKDMVSPEVNYGTLSKWQKKMINKINQLFTWYCKIL